VLLRFGLAAARFADRLAPFSFAGAFFFAALFFVFRLMVSSSKDSVVRAVLWRYFGDRPNRGPPFVGSGGVSSSRSHQRDRGA